MSTPSYKTRRRLALLILLIGLPAYIIASITVINWLERPSIFVELVVYLVLGLLWALPFKFILRVLAKRIRMNPGLEPDAKKVAKTSCMKGKMKLIVRDQPAAR